MVGEQAASDVYICVCMCACMYTNVCEPQYVGQPRANHRTDFDKLCTFVDIHSKL